MSVCELMEMNGPSSEYITNSEVTHGEDMKSETFQSERDILFFEYMPLEETMH